MAVLRFRFKQSVFRVCAFSHYTVLLPYIIYQDLQVPMKTEGRNTEINWLCLPWGVYSLPEEIRNNCKVFWKKCFREKWRVLGDNTYFELGPLRELGGKSGIDLGCAECLDFGYKEQREDIKDDIAWTKSLVWEFPGLSRKLVNIVLCFGWNILCGWRSQFRGW